MSSLMNSAMSGLSGAQAALNIVSNNISSYNVAGYTRQTTILAANGSSQGPGGWMGNGVYVAGVQREYNAFITSQLNAAQNQSSGLTARYQQMAKVNDLLADTTHSISATLQDFFSSLQTLVSNAEDPAARQAVLGKAQGLVSQFSSSDRYLRDQDTQVNAAIVTSVEQINGYARQIADLNDKIASLTAVGAGAAPNDLLDRRDQLVSQLNQVVGVEVSAQQSGSYSVTLANGYTLVQGNTAHRLAAVADSNDPARTTVAYVDDTAGSVTIPEKLLNSGSLGGLLTFRSEDLDRTRNSLNQMAQALAEAFNQQNAQGLDANGDKGGAFFTIGAPTVISNLRNTGDADLSVTVTNSAAVQAADYRVSFDGSSWQVTRQPENAPVTVHTEADGSLSFDGLNITPRGTAHAHDSFTVKPVANAIADMRVALSDASKIAVGANDSSSGESDNRNGQAMLNLQNSKLVGGSKSLNDAWAAIVSDVGNKTATLKTSSATQSSVVTQLTRQQQSISGVNLDEEYGNLQLFQQYYLANAQVMRTASTLFDSLLNLR